MSVTVPDDPPDDWQPPGYVPSTVDDPGPVPGVGGAPIPDCDA